MPIAIQQAAAVALSDKGEAEGAPLVIMISNIPTYRNFGESLNRVLLKAAAAHNQDFVPRSEAVEAPNASNNEEEPAGANSFLCANDLLSHIASARVLLPFPASGKYIILLKLHAEARLIADAILRSHNRPGRQIDIDTPSPLHYNVGAEISCNYVDVRTTFKMNNDASRGDEVSADAWFEKTFCFTPTDHAAFCSICLCGCDSADGKDAAARRQGWVQLPCIGEHYFHVDCFTKIDTGAAAGVTARGCVAAAGIVCPLCRFNMADYRAECVDCAAAGHPHESSSIFWMCLVCGEVRCGQNSKRHAEQHAMMTLTMSRGLQSTCDFDSDNEAEDTEKKLVAPNEQDGGGIHHRYAIEVGGLRVWDFSSGAYVHRILASNLDEYTLAEVGGAVPGDNVNNNDHLQNNTATTNAGEGGYIKSSVSDQKDRTRNKHSKVHWADWAVDSENDNDQQLDGPLSRCVSGGNNVGASNDAVALETTIAQVDIVADFYSKLLQSQLEARGAYFMNKVKLARVEAARQEVQILECTERREIASECNAAYASILKNVTSLFTRCKPPAFGDVGSKKQKENTTADLQATIKGLESNVAALRKTYHSMIASRQQQQQKSGRSAAASSHGAAAVPGSRAETETLLIPIELAEEKAALERELEGLYAAMCT